jgi:hypothetical protein
MLPKHVTDLADNFVRVFDSGRPAMVEFRKARNRGIAPLSQQEATLLGCSAIIPIGNNVATYLEDRDRYIWNKLQHIITSTEMEAYKDLSGDLKLQIAAYCNPVHYAAERFMEDLRVSENVPTGYIVETLTAFSNIISKIHADVDLFCATYAVKAKRQEESASSHIYNIGSVRGIVGNVTDSQVTLNEGLVEPAKMEHIVNPSTSRWESFRACCKAWSPQVKSAVIAGVILIVLTVVGWIRLSGKNSSEGIKEPTIVGTNVTGSALFHGNGNTVTIDNSIHVGGTNVIPGLPAIQIETLDGLPTDLNST